MINVKSGRLAIQPYPEQLNIAFPTWRFRMNKLFPWYRHLAQIAFISLFIFTTFLKAWAVNSKESHPIPFIVGADVTMQTKVEQAGGVFKINGKQEDAFKILRHFGFNTIRLRIFNHPSGQGPMCCDLNYDIALAKRAKSEGFNILLDFHYSDTWADPDHQQIPEAWQNLDFEGLKTALYDYSKAVITAFRKNGVSPEIIQCGNEVNTGMLWPDGRTDSPDGWRRFAQLVQAAEDGCRAALPPGYPILFLHHIAGASSVIWHMTNFIKYGGALPDIIGVSYYPCWHGNLVVLKKNLDQIVDKYHIPVLIVETDYPWTDETFDSTPDIWHGKPLNGMPPFTPYGQAEFYTELINTLKSLPNRMGLGFVPWEPTWLPSKRFGSSQDNLTLFDQHGNALPALEAIRDAIGSYTSVSK